MNITNQLLPAPPAATNQAGGNSADPTRVKKAAEQFEALLLGQLLKSAQPSDEGWLGTGDDQSGSIAMEYAQESFAQAMASRGGLGVASLVLAGLKDQK
jgi:peptidoglycan hydrolase FlgJ